MREHINIPVIRDDSDGARLAACSRGTCKDITAKANRVIDLPPRY